MAEASFWMVWCPDGRAPTYKHPSHRAAEDEACRLAEANPGKKFFILCAVSVASRVSPVSVVPLYRGDDVPF